ncbi:S49 family peptidase [Natronomonas sp. F2-12]|jgi:protease-4|uniref:S49 family peptidase n=1 Tax=Natronomonas aquatica TaxID=2841590 RepID=A0A9R1CUW5_9EURY|nr:S49 family peptidase [Natronomonas aquatica]MCQ4334500.1 S49 family peptidase [Natronomonas aquatica]
MSGLTDRIRSIVATGIRSRLVIVVVALLIGALLAPMAYSVGNRTAESAEQVAVIEVPGLISPGTSGPVVDALVEARQNDSIAAVVLKVDTPGGSLAATEEIALEVERTAAEMPVVVSVGQMAASGGYYVSAPADEIYANPSSMIGSVGINFATLNADADAGYRTIQSGPDKSGGYTEAEAIEMAEVMVEGFYGTVLEHRGEKLELSKAELAHAKVYPSQAALHNGMIDEVGTTEMAIARAAELAGLDRYETVELDTTPDAPGFPLFGTEGGNDTASAVALLDPAPGVETPVPTALYGTIPESDVIVTTAGSEPVSTADEVETTAGTTTEVSEGE